MVICVYCGEKNGSERRSFHRFPLPNEGGLLERWLLNMGFNLNFEISKNKALCSDHFEKEFLIDNSAYNTLRLKKGSIPTIFGRYYLQCVFCNNVKKPGCQKAFHKFPLKNAERMQKWREAIGQENLSINARSLVCNDHFEKNCFFYSSGYAHLRKHAYPTIFSDKIIKEEFPQYEGHIESEIFIEEHKFSPEIKCEFMTEPMEERTSTNNFNGKMHLSTEEFSFPKYMKESRDNSTILAESDETDNSDFLQKETNNVNPNLTGSDVLTSTTPKFIRKSPNPRNSSRCRCITSQDHHYAVNPQTLKKNYVRVRRKLKVVRNESRVQKQHILRLQKKISALNVIVSELRKSQAKMRLVQRSDIISIGK